MAGNDEKLDRIIALLERATGVDTNEDPIADSLGAIMSLMSSLDDRLKKIESQLQRA